MKKLKPNGDEFRTPPRLYRALDAEFHFRLDAACTSSNKLAPRGLARDLGYNGLLEPWAPGPVFCNPPYSDLPTWTRRARLFERETVVMVLPSDPSTGWWHREVAAGASEIRFLQGRVWFRSAEGKELGRSFFRGTAIVIFDSRPGPPIHSYIELPRR